MRRVCFSFMIAALCTSGAFGQELRTPFTDAVLRLDARSAHGILAGNAASRPTAMEISNHLARLARYSQNGSTLLTQGPPKVPDVLAMAKLLLDHGADPQPAVWSAAGRWNHEILEVLLTRGGKADQRRDVQYEHRTPLFDAVCSEDPTAFLERYEDLASKEPVARGASFGFYADLVARMDRTVEVLVRHGADANLPGTWGAVPFHRVCYWGRGPQVRAMLRYGAKVDLRRTPNNVPAHKGTTLPDYTPLHCAALRDSHRNAEVVFILLKAGADWRLKDELGRTPYALAKQKGNLKIARAFESAGVRR